VYKKSGGLEQRRFQDFFLTIGRVLGEREQKYFHEGQNRAQKQRKRFYPFKMFSAPLILFLSLKNNRGIYNNYIERLVLASAPYAPNESFLCFILGK
jgi:hypothetical protein